MWKSSLLTLARRNNYLYLLWMLRVSPRIFEFMLVLDPQATKMIDQNRRSSKSLKLGAMRKVNRGHILHNSAALGGNVAALAVEIQGSYRSVTVASHS
ncbi:hypothetical protein AFLA_000480 [Aspergillus flavus NRRL3357]|nr:hypothetical protein AFLA_000480 [Aspergillus flavus NRRL3357]